MYRGAAYSQYAGWESNRECQVRIVAPAEECIGKVLSMRARVAPLDARQNACILLLYAEIGISMQPWLIGTYLIRSANLLVLPQGTVDGCRCNQDVLTSTGVVAAVSKYTESSYSS